MLRTTFQSFRWTLRNSVLAIENMVLTSLLYNQRITSIPTPDDNILDIIPLSKVPISATTTITMLPTIIFDISYFTGYNFLEIIVLIAKNTIYERPVEIAAPFPPSVGTRRVFPI